MDALTSRAVLTKDQALEGLIDVPASPDPMKWTRLERLRFLLDSWSLIFDPNVTSPFGTGGGGDGIPMLPKMAHDPSVVELELELAQLAKDFPALYRHLKAYRCDAEWRQVRSNIKFRGPNGRMVDGVGWAKQRLVPSWVDLWRVQAAETLLDHRFRGEVFIPKELWDGLIRPIRSA